MDIAQKFVVFVLNEVVTWNRINYPGGTPYNGQNGEAPPERDTFFNIQAYEKVGISVAEVCERVKKSALLVCKKAKNGSETHFKDVKDARKCPGLVTYSY